METTTQNKLTILHGHNSQENAFIIQNYPWGFKFKTEQRIWLEFKAKKGYRVARQTKNPKNGRWCNPKKSTYSEFFALVENQENNHVNSIGFSMYDSAETIEAFKAKWLDQLHPEQILHVDDIIDMKKGFNDRMDKAMKEVKEIVKIDNNTIEENTLIKKSTITKLKEEETFIKMYVYGNGIKSRCRRSDRHFIYLGFFKKPTEGANLVWANDMMSKYIGEIQNTISKYFRSYNNLELCFKDVTYQPASEGSIFYGMKENLFDRNEIKIPLNEFLNEK